MNNTKRFFGLTVCDIIDNIVDHNSVVALWIKDEKDPHYLHRVWKGEGWRIPDPYNDYKFIRIFSSIPNSVLEGDVVNIEIKNI